jgi:hypothetical protein
VRRITGHTTQRDFKASEAIAVGAMISGLVKDGGSPYVPVAVLGMPALTLNLSFEGHTTQFCKRNDRCESVVNFTDLDDLPEQFIIEGKPSNLPEGVNSTLAVFETDVPINLTGPRPFNASFRVNGLEAFIISVRFCNADGECEQSKTSPIPITDPETETRTRGFVAQFLNSRGNKPLRSRLITVLNKLNALRKRLETRKVEATVVMTDEMKKSLTDLTAIYDQDALESLDSVELKRWNRTLTSYVKELRVKV